MTELLLALDASTYVATTALLRDGHVIAEDVAAMRGEHEERLMPAVAELFARTGVHPSSVDGIVCGAGPGSFTSLRIAASIAKGLAVSLGAGLSSVSSLALIVAGRNAAPAPGRYVATLDAMRGEVYAQRFSVDPDGTISTEGPVELIPAGEVQSRSATAGAVALGPGVGDASMPHARGVARLAGGGLVEAVDLARWEPHYGRLAEAQVKWERAHGRALGSDT